MVGMTRSLIILFMIFYLGACYGQEEENANIYFSRGNNLWNKHKYNEAIIEYTKAININPKFADAYKNRGNVYLDKRDYKNALSDYKKAIEVRPNFPNAYYNIGVIYSRIGDYDQAIANYSRAIEISPNFALAFIMRGDAYCEKGDYDKALEYIKQNYPESTEITEQVFDQICKNMIDILYKWFSEHCYKGTN